MSMIDPKGSRDASEAMALVRAHKKQKSAAIADIAALRQHSNWEYEVGLTTSPNQKPTNPDCDG